MKKVVVFYIEDIERAKFFIRFEFQNDIKSLFITNNLTVYLYLKYKGKNICLLNISNESHIIEIPNLNNTIERKLKYCSKEKSNKLYLSVYNTLDNLKNEYEIKYIFIWNGNKIGDYACKYFSQRNNIKSLFFEISNIPGKIFVDEEGTNKNSSLFLNPEKIDKLNYNENEYQNWKKEYLKIKSSNFILPQSKKRNKLLALVSIFISYIGILGGISVQNFCLWSKLKELNLFKTNNILLKSNNNIDIKNLRGYIFVPLQVENDTQVIINSKVSLKTLIDYAVNYAKKEKLKVLIKPHPAERNNKILEYINSLVKDNIIVTNYNTVELIQNARTVITINSTVGLEALILNKSVIFLGDTFYKNFDQERLKKYVLKYLINIEYFSNDKISGSSLIKYIR